jgi:acetyl-CoA carboxylase carboxyl transferase subunit beta
MGWFRRSDKKVSEPVPTEDLWVVCPACQAHIYRQEWVNNLKVCPKCNFHERLTYAERINILIDNGTFRELYENITTSDPLGFVDAKGPYAEKAKSTIESTGMREAVVTGDGRIHGIQVTVAVMDFRFLGGSLGSGTGEKIRRAAEHARRHRFPYIVVCTSGGARMHEGIISLMQMAKTCASLSRLAKEGVPYIAVLTDPTTGGVSASFGMVGDITIAEPKALIGFAGRRVIEQTIKQQLPDDFQTAEYLLAHGFVDHIVNRREMKDFLHRVLLYYNK